MPARLVIVDGYNLILRTPALKPGEGRTLRESRDKLLNLLAWTMGEQVRFLVVFDGAHIGGRPAQQGRVEVRYSEPPEKADDVIRRVVEEQMRKVERLTVVTADLAVARHARAMGADIALADLFLASALGPAASGDPEKPVALTKRELEEWAELFRSRGGSAPEDPDDDE